MPVPSAVLAASDEALASPAAGASNPGTERHLMELCGVYESHQAPRPALLQRLLTATDPRVRAYATRVAGAWTGVLPDVLSLLEKSIHDPHPRVRLESVVACARIPRPEAASLAVQALDHPADKFITYALRQTIRALQPHWQPVLANMKFDPAPSPEARTRRENYLKSLASAPPPIVPPGKIIYDTLCLNCHQPEGHGLPGIYPPVSKSDWVSGPPERLIKILLHGLTGQIKVSGGAFIQTTSLPMPPMGLDDQQIADLCQYLRSNFGNDAPAISVETVRKTREDNSTRRTPWTEAELGDP